MITKKIDLIDLNPSNAPIKILNEYINFYQGISPEKYTIYIVWSCKTLRNRKWILYTSLPDNILYELTYDGYKDEYYLDEYQKLSNTTVKPVYPMTKD